MPSSHHKILNIPIAFNLGLRKPSAVSNEQILASLIYGCSSTVSLTLGFSSRVQARPPLGSDRHERNKIGKSPQLRCKVTPPNDHVLFWLFIINSSCLMKIRVSQQEAKKRKNDIMTLVSGLEGPVEHA